MPAPEPDLLKENIPGPPLAIAAEALFLANLMVAPGLAFLVLVALWWRHRRDAPSVAKNHLTQTVVASLWGGGALFGMSAAVFLLGGLDNPWSWVLGVLYFVCFHALLIVFGVIGLNHAILAKPWRYPVFGPPLDS